MSGGGRDGVRWRGQWVQVSKRNEISILHHVRETAGGREQVQSSLHSFDAEELISE